LKKPAPPLRPPPEIDVLADGRSEYTGEAEGPDFEKTRMEVAATAVLEAARQAAEADLILALQGIEQVDAFGQTFVLASVNGSVRRRSSALAGVVRVEDSPEEAAVLACLQAVNRWIAVR
jgi:hypothetical protein